MRERYGSSPVLTRYIARSFALRIVAVLIGLLAVLQILDVIGESNRILAAPGTTEADLWRYGLLRLPLLVTQFLPFAVLLAALVTFGALAASSQVVVMRAMGLSPHQILAPMVTVAAISAGIYLVWNETVTVRAAAHLAAWQATDYGARIPVPGEPAPETWVMADGAVIRARPTALPGGGVALADVAIFRQKNGGLDGVLLAERGILSDTGEGELENVREMAINMDAAKGEMRVTPHIFWQPGITAAYFFEHAVDAEHTALPALATAARAVAGVGKDAHALHTELYHRLARPAALLLMPLLGAVAAFGIARKGTVLVRAGIGLGLGFSFFVADNVVMSLGRSGDLPPSLAAVLPLLLFLIISEAILFRTEQ